MIQNRLAKVAYLNTFILWKPGLRIFTVKATPNKAHYQGLFISSSLFRIIYLNQAVDQPKLGYDT